MTGCKQLLRFFAVVFFASRFLLGQSSFDLSLPDLSNQSMKLSDYRGKIVVVNFWATWCQPCRKEIPVLVHLQNQYSGQVQFVGVSIDEPEDQKTVAKFVNRLGINYPIWINGTTEQMKPFGLATAIPATVVLTEAGERAFRIIGEVKQPILEERLNWLLSDRTSPKPQELVLPAGVTPEHFAKHESGQEDEEEQARERAGQDSAVPS